MLTEPLRTMQIIVTFACSLLSGVGALGAQAQSTIAISSMAPTDSTRQSVTLRMVLERAVTRYPLVAAARAHIRAAQGSRVTAGTFGNPVLSYEVDNTPFPGGREIPGLDREAMTTVTLPLEPLYQRGPRVRRANADVRVASAAALVTRQRVALEAANAFYRMATAQVQWVAARDLASWLDSVVTYNRARVSQGAAAESDLIRSELEHDRAAADVAMAAADLARARADLSVYLGGPDSLTSSRPIVVESVPFALAAPQSDDVSVSPSMATTEDVERMQRAGINARPDINAARERVQAAIASVATEHTMLFRQLGATLGTKQTMGTTSMIVGISLPFPLFDQNRGEVARASAEREAAQLELTAQERTARAEIVGAYEAARLLTAQAITLTRPGQQSYLARADEARHIEFGAYREGAVPLLQVLDAARAWEEAQVAYYRVLFAQQQSVLALRVAEGVDPIAGLPAFDTSNTANALQ